MKPADWKRVVKPFLGDRWATKGRLAYLRPLDRHHVLSGVVAERSSGEGCYLWQFRLPLYGPATEVLVLDWSERVGGSSRTYSFEEMTEGRELSEAIRRAEFESMLENVLVDPPGGAESASMQEVRGYGLLLQGDSLGALECLTRVQQTEMRAGWQQKLVDRAASMAELIEGGQAAVVLRHVKSWRAETMANLGLESA